MTDIRERFARELGPGGLEARGYVTEARAEGDDAPTISGIGSPYGQVSRIAGWFEEWDEVVADGAWRNTITRDGADIVSTFNHDLNQLLARTSADTLTLTDPAEGLMYEAQINPDDAQAMSVHAKVQRRDVSGASVWFRVVKDQWEEPTDNNDLEVAKRTILDAELFEVGPVVMPAFPQTSAETTAAHFRQLGYTRSGLMAMDGTLRAAGVHKAQRLAALTQRFLADPDTVEQEIRALLARAPDLRERVCDSAVCDCSDRAAAAAEETDPPAPEVDESSPSPPQPQVPTDPDEVRQQLRRIWLERYVNI